MAFGDKNNYGKKTASSSANTFGQKFYNIDSKVDPSMLTVNFFGQLVEIKFNPALPINKRKEGESSYDLDSESRMFLPRHLIRALIFGFDKFIDPILKGTSKSENTEVSVNTTKGAILTIGTGKKYNCNPYVKLELLNPDTFQLDYSILHEFTDNSVVLNREEGKIDSGEEVVFENKIYEFVDTLRQAEMALSFGIAHSVKEAMNYNINSIKESLGKFLETQGISTGTSTSKRPKRTINTPVAEQADINTDEIAAELEK